MNLPEKYFRFDQREKSAGVKLSKVQRWENMIVENVRNRFGPSVH